MNCRSIQRSSRHPATAFPFATAGNYPPPNAKYANNTPGVSWNQSSRSGRGKLYAIIECMLRAGHRIGPYELLSPIGAGGMGEVWKVRDKRLDRIVAIKFSQAAFTDRFQQEARAIAALNHPNIATLYDVGPDYLVINATGASCAWAADGGTIFYRGATGARAVSADGKNDRPVYSSGRGVFGLLPSGELLIAQARGTPPVATLMRVDPMSGKLISSVPLALPEGYSPLMATLAVRPSGKKIVISTSKASIDLFPIQGFAQPETGWRRVFGHWQTPPVSKGER